jgi:hypothetical protein
MAAEASAGQPAIAFVAIVKEVVAGDRFAPLREVGVVRLHATTLKIERVVHITLGPNPTVYSTTGEPEGPRVVGPLPHTVEATVAELIGVLDGAVVVGWDATRVCDALEWAAFDVSEPWRRNLPRLMDLPGLAWSALGYLPASPDDLARVLRMEPPTDGALAEAWWMARVAIRLREAQKLGARIALLTGHEGLIAGHILDRLEAGHEVYGAWLVDDGRDLKRETIEELVDTAHYLSAEVVRLERLLAGQRGRRFRPVVLCVHSDPRHLDDVAGQVLAEGATPILAQQVLGHYLRDGMAADRAVRFMVDGSDEVRVFGGPVSAEMRELVSYAQQRRRRVRFVRQEASS